MLFTGIRANPCASVLLSAGLHAHSHHDACKKMVLCAGIRGNPFASVLLSAGLHVLEVMMGTVPLSCMGFVIKYFDDTWCDTVYKHALLPRVEA